MMRDKAATTILWSESIFYCFLMPLLRQYLIYSGIVFNAFVILVVVYWR